MRLLLYAPIRISALQKLRRSISGGRALSVPWTERSNTAGITSATTPRNSMAEVLVAEVRWNFCERRPRPPTKNERPSTSNRLPMMLPVIDALTSSMCPLRSATTAMINSAALPNVALRKPPSPAPARRASCSVPRPINPASGISETAAVMKTHGEPGSVHARNHDSGAAASSRLSGEETMARNM